MTVPFSRKGCAMLVVGLGVLSTLASCSGRKVTTSVEDQNLLQSQGAPTQLADTGSLPSEAASTTKPQIASAPSPATMLPGQNNPTRSDISRLLPPSPGALGDVFFDYDRFALRNDARTTLESNARWLKSQNGLKVLIEGHCDERGTLAYNLVLGERRAQSVQKYLQELGIPPSQLQIVSYGKERPVCTEPREACWQQNRRGHFVVKGRDK